MAGVPTTMVKVTVSQLACLMEMAGPILRQINTPGSTGLRSTILQAHKQTRTELGPAITSTKESSWGINTVMASVMAGARV